MFLHIPFTGCNIRDSLSKQHPASKREYANVVIISIQTRC